jgi:hypothetical protein
MNGKIKFHKGTSPAFRAGEVWFPCDSTPSPVKIVSCNPFHSLTEPTHCSDFNVVYEWNGQLFEKDAWNFQTRYTHSADRFLQLSERT